MPYCVECGKDVLDNYQTISTKRNTKIVICDKCIEQQRKEAKRARDNQKSI